jgi:peroxiredoxin
MSNIQIGTLVLNAELLIYVLAGVVGVLAVRFRQRAHADKEVIVSEAWNAFILWLVVWKGSLLLFDPVNVMKHPLSLVFFSGGTKGVGLAFIVTIVYMGFRYRRKLGRAQAAAVIATMCSGAVAGVYLAQILLYDSVGKDSYGLFIVSAALLTVLLSSSPRYVARVLGILLIVTMIASIIYDQVGGRNTDDQQAANEVEVGIRNNQLAPDIQLTNLEGSSVKLSDYRGRTVLINFWATWCQVCKTEMPHIERIYQSFKDEGVVILSVNATSLEKNTQRVGSYAEKHGLSFPIVLDEQGAVIKQYKVTAYPTTFIVDTKGIIRNQYLGAVSYESMKKAIQAIS